eukprot:Nitzschia sp. Nitz4//scaffold16_size188269//20445//22369//NITZ4_001769-RA/size188269-augustus-gene-0.88-mRNA-1//-1//CDS//3329538449//2084//frame0
MNDGPKNCWEGFSPSLSDPFLLPTMTDPPETVGSHSADTISYVSMDFGSNRGPTVTNDFVQTPAHPIPAEVQIDYYGLALVFLAPALGGFLYGYDIGATSFVLAMLRDSRDHDSWWHGISKFQQGWVVSTLALGALLGSHVVLVYLAKSIGRRKEIRIAATLYVVGAMLNVMSGTILATSEKGWFGFSTGFVVLIVGRLLYGAGVGFIMHGAPTYMAEMSPSTVRGAVVSAKETVIVFGIVVGMWMGDLISDYPENWSDLYAFSILGAVTMLLLTFKIPRSKRWLLMKGYREEAKESMQFVYKGDIEDEFELMAETIDQICCQNEAAVGDLPDDGMSVISNKASMEESRVRRVDSIHEMAAQRGIKIQEDQHSSLFGPQYKPIMVIGIGLLIAQQFSGQPSVLAYSRVLFEAAGWQGHASVVTVIIMGCTSTLTVALVDRLGRKVLLLTGCAIMMMALSALTYGFWGWDDNDEDYYLSTLKQQLVLWSMFIYVAGYQVGYGPVTWTLLSEIYPSEIRGTAMALSVEINFLAKFLVQLFFPMVQDLLGWGCTFILFIVISGASFLFIRWNVPETTGMSLEEIQVQLRQGFQPQQDRTSSSDNTNNQTKPIV